MRYLDDLEECEINMHFGIFHVKEASVLVKLVDNNITILDPDFSENEELTKLARNKFYLERANKKNTVKMCEWLREKMPGEITCYF